MSLFDGYRRRNEGDLEVEIDMVPVMNMFLVLIPFLLLSSNFLHLKAINTSVPVKSATAVVSEQKPSNIEITAIVEIRDGAVLLSATSESLTDDVLKQLDGNFPKAPGDLEYPLDKLSLALQEIKTQYPKSNTVILIPGDNISYDTIVRTMDAARRVNDLMLFPNVVLSGAVSANSVSNRAEASVGKV